MKENERGLPTDVSDEEWEFCVSYLRLMREDAPQREHDMREIFNALRWVVRTGCAWRLLPTKLPFTVNGGRASTIFAQLGMAVGNC